MWCSCDRASLPAGSIAGALYHKLQTQSSAPEDGRNYRPEHVELIVIINKICYCCFSFNMLTHIPWNFSAAIFRLECKIISYSDKILLLGIINKISRPY